MSDLQWKSWRFMVIHFAEPVVCGKCWLRKEPNTTTYGMQQLGAPFNRHVESLCVECAEETVKENRAIDQWVAACQQIVDEAEAAALMGKGVNGDAI